MRLRLSAAACGRMETCIVSACVLKGKGNVGVGLWSAPLQVGGQHYNITYGWFTADYTLAGGRQRFLQSTVGPVTTWQPFSFSLMACFSDGPVDPTQGYLAHVSRAGCLQAAECGCALLVVIVV